MTATVTRDRRESAGSERSVVGTVDITSLDGAATEPFDPSATYGIEGATVEVVGVENAATYVVQYDHLEGEFVVQTHGGTDPGAGTNIGEVRVRVTGDAGA